MKGLKFIPTPPKPASHKNLLKDFEAFTRSVGLQYQETVQIRTIATTNMLECKKGANFFIVCTYFWLV